MSVRIGAVLWGHSSLYTGFIRGCRGECLFLVQRTFSDTPYRGFMPIQPVKVIISPDHPARIPPLNICGWHRDRSLSLSHTLDSPALSIKCTVINGFQNFSFCLSSRYVFHESSLKNQSLLWKAWLNWARFSCFMWSDLNRTPAT